MPKFISYTPYQLFETMFEKQNVSFLIWSDIFLKMINWNARVGLFAFLTHWFVIRLNSSQTENMLESLLWKGNISLAQHVTCNVFPRSGIRSLEEYLLPRYRKGTGL